MEHWLVLDQNKMADFIFVVPILAFYLIFKNIFCIL